MQTLTLPLKEKCSPIGVQLHELPAYWQYAEPLIQKALDRGSEYTIEEIYDGLKTAQMQLWMYGNHSALVTTIQNKGDKRWLLLLALGGEQMTEWFEYFPMLEEWAKWKGCTELRVYGRLGWAKYLKPSGFEVKWVKIVKEL